MAISIVLEEFFKILLQGGDGASLDKACPVFGGLYLMLEGL